MSLFGKKSKNSGCTSCMVTNIVTAVLLLVATVAAAIGVYKAHFLAAGATFGTSNGSLSIIAFVLAVTLCAKSCKMCCCSMDQKK